MGISSTWILFPLLVAIADPISAQVCNGNGVFRSASSSGSLSVPMYYNMNQFCHWEITASRNEVVRLSISRLRLSTRPFCGADKVIVTDDNDNVLREFCGAWDNPPAVVSSSNVMHVLFISDGTYTHDQGFQASWRTESKGSVHCPSEVNLNSPTGTISSSGSRDNNYANSANCIWRINVPGAESITLTFNKMDLETQWKCLKDYVTVSDGERRVIATSCNSQTKSPVVVNGDTMNVQFYSDEKIVGSGFRASYEAKFAITTTTTTTTTTMTTTTAGAQGETSQCSSFLYARLRSDSGSLSTPLNSSYNPNQYCVWDILVSSEKVVVVNLERFELKSSSNCNGDRLEVVDRRNTILRRICGTMNPPPKINAGSDWMRLLFYSGRSTRTARGFYASWSAQEPSMASCSGVDTLTSPSGIITNSKNGLDYTNRANCIWKIRVASNMGIEITFSRVDLKNTIGCLNDWVKIYSGLLPAESQKIATLCDADKVTPVTYNTSGNTMYIEFRSDQSVVGSGFAASYRSVPQITSPTPSPGPGTSTPSPPPRFRCGLRSLQRIPEGQPTRPHSWPWHVSIRLNPNKHYCGGSLVNNKWVMTSAHCVGHLNSRNRRQYSVVIGVHNLATEVGEVRSIQRVELHPDFRTLNDSHGPYHENDIALVELSSPVTYTASGIAPICLPKEDFGVGKNCSIVGWGELDRDNQRDFPDELLYSAAPIEHDFYCGTTYFNKYKRETMLCAGFYDGYGSPCKGDSGGALACPDDSNVFHIQGIISFNYGCRSNTVYTRVTHYLPWIRSILP